ncbi:type I restriction endonuclease subunit R [Bacteroides sp.]
MKHISFKENHISRVPALLLLQKLGYAYLTPEEALKLRGGKTASILLEDILRKQLNAINSIRINKRKTERFSAQNIEYGISAMRNIPLKEGFMNGNKYIYNLLTVGKALEQEINGDKKSHTLKYIDWENPKRNVYHVTEEFTVNRVGSTDTYRADIVLFVNGIPLCIIECARPDINDPLRQAIEQQLHYQKEDGIQSLYLYSALLLSMTPSTALYATTGTPKALWTEWREQTATQKEEDKYHKNLQQIINRPLNEEQKEKFFKDRYLYVKDLFEKPEQLPATPTGQDYHIYNLCRPERLLDLIFNFTIYDDGSKRIARYYQYFTVKKTMEQISILQNGKRKGGIIWHTQGSGKSLTMVMLAQAIMQNKAIANPKVILVTDRMNADQQITDTFKKCGIYAENAKTGTMLIELLESKTATVITTVIHKFETAIRKLKAPLTSPDIFILIDEAQRSQCGEMSFNMSKTLPNACRIAMTGTPLLKEEKAIARFGEIIKPVYSIQQAVKDKVIVPLLYERRAIADSQKMEQRIYNIARDLSYHFRNNWQETGFKGLLVCSGKQVAIQYKRYLDEIGIVSTEVLIAPSGDWEGEETDNLGSNSCEEAFWEQIMNKYGTAKNYETNIINQFCNSKIPEIIIVVDKLLTGFDKPKNIVIYLDRKLNRHTLLQAVTRVNRICDGKRFGYIIDYYGVLQESEKTLVPYTGNEQERQQELEQMLTDISVEINKLPQMHQKLWDLFKKLPDGHKPEIYVQLLRHKDIRQKFYNNLSAYAYCLKIALSTTEFYKYTPEEEVAQYKKDLISFAKLQILTQQRYSDTIDNKQQETLIQKLIDTYADNEKINVAIKLADIFDKDKFEEEIYNITGDAAKADTIASRTLRYIEEHMNSDPTFYKKISDSLEQVISDYEKRHMDETEYLRKVTEYKESILSHTNNEVPALLAENNMGKAFFGLSLEIYKTLLPGNSGNDANESALQTALAFDTIIKSHIIEDSELIVEWQTKNSIIGKIKIEMEDYLIDNIKQKWNINLTFEQIDLMIEQCMKIAKLWVK